MSDASGAVHVALRSLTKTYGGVRALREVDLDIERGSIHALVGENGAGKSTLGKIIAGAVRPTAGQMLVDGEPVSFAAPRQALGRGIAIIDQELAMVPARSVLDNVFLGAESRRLGLFRASDQRRRFAELIERSGFDLDPNVTVGTLAVADKQKVEILRSLAREARLIVMDEPTATLTPIEADQLYGIIRGLQAQGTTIVFVSHFLEEVLALADTITVMRDGRIVETAAASEQTPESLVHLMLGRPMDLAFPDRPPQPGDVPPMLELEGVSAPGRISDVSLTVRPGEIVGLAGLVGSGRTDVARAIAGVDRIGAGVIRIDSQPIVLRSPRDAIRQGIAYLPESRKDEGLVMRRSVAENLSLAKLGQVSSAGILRSRRERVAVDRTVERLDVRCASTSMPVESLSGGNQQKVLFGKWLTGPPRLLVVDEPTRGVDVGAKRAIYDLIVALASGGMAVLMISSELEEVLGMSHRVLVMRRGRIAADLPHEQADEATVLGAAFGTKAAR